MRSFAPFIALLAACTSQPQGETGDPWAPWRFDGTLAELRDDVLVARFAAAGSDDYAPPNTQERDALRAAIDDLTRGIHDVADLLAAAGFQLSVVEEDGRTVAVVWEQPGARGHRGALFLSFDRDLPLVVESPHSGFDTDTGLQAFDLFTSLGAWAWITSGAHRCASETPSPCDGTTGVCGADAPYRISDMAHADGSAFQVMHEALLDRDGAAIAVSVHGFSWTSGEPDAFVSDGTSRDQLGSWAPNTVKAAMETAGARVASCNDSADNPVARLCGTTNVQGRYANGVTAPCTAAADAASGRFVHVEQRRELREAASWEVLRAGLAALWR